MIEPLPDFPANVLAFQCKGHVTQQDYESVLIPAVNSSLKKHDKIRLFYKIGEDFNGIDPGAIWDDFSVGMSHLLRWERLAVVTDVSWIANSIRAFGFLMPGKLRLFSLKDELEARAWIVA
jgi:hypothetical protein